MSNANQALLLLAQQRTEALRSKQQKEEAEQGLKTVENKAYQNQVSGLQCKNMRIDPDLWNNSNLD